VANTDAAALLVMMQELLRECRAKSQEDVLKAFLRRVIHARRFTESGSIVINYPEERKLRLFNPQNFLTSDGYLKAGGPWQVEFNYGQGIAGEAFVKRSAVAFYSNSGKRLEFSTVEGQVPISSMICVPIIPDDRSTPFGVAFVSQQQSFRYLFDRG
jgi:hypothetical protein